MSELLWIDKYAPCKLQDLDFNQSQCQLLCNLASQQLPHILFYGPPGSGKKTRIMCLLQHLFGSSVYKLKKSSRTFKSNSVKVDINILESNHHIDISPSDVGFHDRIIIQQLVKEIGSMKSLQGTYKVLVINHGDQLSIDAQAALRRTMEKYAASVRFIITCNNLSKIIGPIRSRCQNIRNPAPTDEEIYAILQKISGSENITLPKELGNKIIEQSQRNLRKAINNLQILKIQTPVLKSNQAIPIAAYELEIQKIVQKCLQSQNAESLKFARGKFYELLINQIPTPLIFQLLTTNFAGQTQSQYPTFGFKVVNEAARFEALSQQGSKAILHLEAFLAKVMYDYRLLVCQGIARR